MDIQTSILIRTKNEARYLAKTLDLIRDQSIKPKEIIVVDSGSTDGTVEIVKQQPDIKLIQITPEQFTYGFSLNIGFKSAQAEIVICLSAHAFPYDREWLYHLIKHFANPQVAGVYGKQIPQPDAWPPVQRDILNCYGNQQRIQFRAINSKDHFFSNANSAIRLLDWQKIPFDETLTYAEDSEWAKSIIELGSKIIYEPEAVVYHSHNEHLFNVHRRKYNEALAFKTLYNTQMTLRGTWETWYRAVIADIQFILKNKRDRWWILRSPIYRLFWVLGFLRPHLPQAFWEPLTKRWKQISNKITKTE